MSDNYTTNKEIIKQGDYDENSEETLELKGNYQIEYHAFFNCPSLTTLIIYEAEYMPSYMIHKAPELKRIVLGNTKAIFPNAFDITRPSKLETIEIESADVINNRSFYEKKLKTLKIGTVDEIKSLAFEKSSIETVTINGPIGIIDEYAFKDLSAKTLTCGSVKEIKSLAFSGSKAKTIIIDGTNGTLAAHAFKDSSIETIILKGTVENLDHQAFDGCETLKAIYCSKEQKEQLFAHRFKKKILELVHPLEELENQNKTGTTIIKDCECITGEVSTQQIPTVGMSENIFTQLQTAQTENVTKLEK